MCNYDSIKQNYCGDALMLNTQGLNPKDLFHIDRESGRGIIIKKNATLDDVGVALVNGSIEYHDGRTWCMINDISMNDWLWLFGLVIRIQDRGIPNVPVS